MLSEVLDRCLREVQAEAKRAQVEQPLPPNAVVAPPVNRTPNSPTDEQIKFFHTLVEGKELSDDQKASLLSALPTLTKQSITTTIQWLIGLPWKKRTWVPRAASTSSSTRFNPRPPKLKIMEGYYAVTDPQDNLLKFYHVQTPNKGKWSGYVFLKQVSGENKFPVRDKNKREEIFKEILKDAMGALRRFGIEIGQCGHCRKQLTDDISRSFGIGPVCRKKLGI